MEQGVPSELGEITIPTDEHVEYFLEYLIDTSFSLVKLGYFGT